MYEDLVTWLEDRGYEVERLPDPVTVNSPKCYMFTGKGVRGGFCEPSDQCYSELDGRIAVDNVECFDKWSKCPLVMKLPCDLSRLENSLEFLGSKAGHDHSNSYEYLDQPILPRELDEDDD